MKKVNWSKVTDAFLVVAGVILAVVLRYSLLDFKSVDFFAYTHGWYNTIQTNGFSAFRLDFANYNPPYLYLLYFVARFFPNIPDVVAVKLPSIAADFVSAWLASRIVALKYPDSPIPLFAGFAVMYAPTVVLNSAFWGQADSLYTTALIASIYFLMIRKPGPAMLFYGLSISFKAQAIFLSPLLFALLLRKEISWKYFLFIPLVMILALIPAWIAGRSLLSLLAIYPSQAGQYQQLSMHAPSLFSWIPNSGALYPYFYPLGLTLAAATGLFYSMYIYRSRGQLTPSALLEFAFVSILLMPFVLPQMHERYFYPADIFSIVFAFYFPNFFFVPIIMSTISFFSYQPTLFDVEPVPINLLAIGILFLLIILIRHIILMRVADDNPH